MERTKDQGGRKHKKLVESIRREMREQIRTREKDRGVARQMGKNMKTTVDCNVEV